MSNLIKNEVHARHHRVIIDRRELERVVAAIVAKAVGADLTDANTTVKVKFNDATEGSPAYRVGTECVVEITEDLQPKPAETVEEFIRHEVPHVDLVAMLALDALTVPPAMPNAFAMEGSGAERTSP